MISYLYAALIAVGTLVIGILLGIWIRKRAAKRAEEKISTPMKRRFVCQRSDQER